MYIVNTTFIVEPQSHDKWIDIIKRDYIPFLRQKGFDKIIFSRVISIDSVDHFTYSLQVDAENIDSYKLLTSDVFDEYTTIAEPMFGSSVVWFTSLLKIVEL